MKPYRAPTPADDIPTFYISESLLKILQQHKSSARTGTIQGDKQGEKYQKQQKQQQKNRPDDNGKNMSTEPGSIMATPPPPGPTFDPNYIMRQAAFDPSILLYGIRGEYERKFQQYQQLWRQRWDELDRINRDLHHQSSRKLAQEIERIEKRYFHNHDSLLEKPCASMENALVRCYSDHRGQPLLCRAEVKQFAQCIEDNRIKMLRHKQQQK